MTRNAILSAEDSRKHVTNLGGTEIGKEAQLAEVDAQHWSLTIGHLPGGTEDGAVAPEDQGEVGTGIAEVFGLQKVGDGHVAALTQEGEQPVGLLADPWTMGVTEHKHTHRCTSKRAEYLSARHIREEKGREKCRRCRLECRLAQEGRDEMPECDATPTAPTINPLK
jgi:hypothetical protein